MHYKWKMSETKFSKKKGKVFTCFAGGGGSSLGYKLAGFDVIGCNEIDYKMFGVYVANHTPKYAYLESITTLAKRKDLPGELYNLDILDGSPPCSSFSMAGTREEDWGKEKMFREGQVEQVLDTLFFDFIDLAKELQPKIVVAENVTGLLQGNAKDYVIKIYNQLEEAGYYVQHFVLDASKMGVPQSRERVFFIALRKDLAKPFLEQIDMFTHVPRLNLNFDEKPILFEEIYMPGVYDSKHALGKMYDIWLERIESDNSIGSINKRVFDNESMFTVMLIKSNEVCPTLTRRDRTILFDEYRSMNNTEFALATSFPLDYDFKKMNPTYVMGMSVPPLMVAKIAQNIYEQWISKI